MKRSKNRNDIIIIILSFILAAIIIIAVLLLSKSEGANDIEAVDSPPTTESIINNNQNSAPVFESEEDVWEHLRQHAQKKGYDINDYPEKSGWLLMHSPDEYDFLIDYPANKWSEHSINLEQYRNTDKVPLLIQWDKQWGYSKYGSNGTIGVNGCGVVCLSMVAVYLTGDTQYDPVYMANYAVEHGYYIDGSGTTWDLFNKGGIEFGIKSSSVTLTESTFRNAVENGNPIVLNVGNGDFTNEGHYIVVSGYENGKFIINDPNSTINSSRLWKWDTLLPQIKNAWEFDKA